MKVILSIKTVAVVPVVLLTFLLSNIVFAQWRDSESEEARAHYWRALEYEKMASKLQTDSGRKKYRHMAIDELQQAVYIDPNYADAYHRLGHICFDVKEYQKCIDAEKKFLEVTGKDAEWNAYRLRECYAALGNQKEAAKYDRIFRADHEKKQKKARYDREANFQRQRDDRKRAIRRMKAKPPHLVACNGYNDNYPLLEHYYKLKLWELLLESHALPESDPVQYLERYANFDKTVLYDTLISYLVRHKNKFLVNLDEKVEQTKPKWFYQISGEDIEIAHFSNMDKGQLLGAGRDYYVRSDTRQKVDVSHRILVKIRLNALSDSYVDPAMIKSVYFYLSGSNIAERALSSYRILRKWDPAYASWYNFSESGEWDNPGGDYDRDTGVLAEFCAIKDEIKYSEDASKLIPSQVQGFNITRYFQEWISGDAANYGFIIREPHNELIIHSWVSYFYDKTSSLAPRALIIFESETEPDLEDVGRYHEEWDIFYRAGLHALVEKKLNKVIFYWDQAHRQCTHGIIKKEIERHLSLLNELKATHSIKPKSGFIYNLSSEIRKILVYWKNVYSALKKTDKSS